MPRTEASAQSTAFPADSAAIVRGAIMKLHPQSGVRVRSRESVTDGRFAGSAGDTLWIAHAGGHSIGVPIAQIDRIWSRQRNGALGALAGGVLGALFVGAYGSLVDDVVGGLCNPDYCEKTDGGSSAAAGAIVGGLGGGVVGFIIGRTTSRWQSRHP